MRRIIAVILMFGCSSVWAGDSSFHLGLLGNFYSTTPEDPDGPVASDVVFSTLNGIMTYDFGRDSRALIHVFQNNSEHEPSTKDIGQSVTRTGASFSYQSLFRFSRRWKPWLGAGLSFTQFTAEDRHTVTFDGFKDKVFEDRDESYFGGVLTATTQWAVSDNWDIGLHVAYEQDFGDGAKLITAGLTVLY